MIYKRPFLAAGLIIVMLIAAISGLTMVSMKTGTETYLNLDEPVGSLVDHYSDEFGSSSIILIIEGEDLSSPGVLEYLDSLEEDFRDERYVDGVSSLASFLKSANDGVLPQSTAEINNILDNSGDALDSVLPSPILSLMYITLESGLSDDSQTGTVNMAESVLECSEPPAGVTITISGSPAFSVEMQEDMGSSTMSLIVLALLLMIIAMVFLFGHVRYRMLPVFTVFCGIILTFGVMGFAGIKISTVVVAAFPVLIGIGIDYGIQLHSRLDEEIRKTSSLKDAVFITVANSGPAVLLAMIATSLGFVALKLLAPAPMVGDFGTICIVGVICCYITALLIIPTFAVIFKYKPKKGELNALDSAESCQLEWKGCDDKPNVKKGSKGSFMEKYDILLGNLAAKIARHPVAVILVLLMVGIVGIQLDDRIIVDCDEDAMVSQTMPAKISMNKIESTIGSTSSITAYIKGDSIKDVDTLQWIDDFSNYVLNKQDEIIGVSSIVSVIKEYNNGVLPGNQQEIDAIWDEIPSDTINQYVSGNTETVIDFSMNDLSMPKTQSLINNLNDDLDWYGSHPGITVTFTGQMVMFSWMMEQISDSKNLMTYAGFLFILIYLLLVYRRFSAISPLVPIVIIVGWNSLIMYCLGLTYSLLTACLGAMTIGVACEYTILIMERYQEEKAKGGDMITSIQTAVQKIGTAITVSGLTTVLGFSALILASSPMIQNFGITTVMTVAFSLVGAIVVMPAVIALFEQFRTYVDKRKAGEAGVRL
ncbi:efflux RND transporter permease subunit [Methanolacinia petrolearia]|nr:hydrophobe/amphiphile efflux-3 (HAE3) family transporter [Methanolacinia petrolearia]